MPLSDYHVRASIAVSDIGRAVAFYEGRLGLQPLSSGPSVAIPSGSGVCGCGGRPCVERVPVSDGGKVTSDTGDVVRR